MNSLEIAKMNLRRAQAADKSHLPDVGQRWKTYSSQICELADQARNAREVIDATMLWQGSFESRHSGEALRGYAADLDAMLLHEYPNFANHFASFTEIQTAPVDKAIVSNGRLVSSPVLGQTYNILRCISQLRPRTILDIGGGIGATGRLWMTNSLHRPKRYIDLDLPESLFLAEVYLRENLPNHRIAYIHNIRDVIAARVCMAKVVLIPSHNHYLVPWLSPYLAYNTGSLQEMTPEFVELYTMVIDRSGAKYFYSSNYFAQKIEVLIESMNYAAPTMGDGWRTIFRRWLPDADRGVAQLLFERGSTSTVNIDDMEVGDQHGFLDLFDAIRTSSDPQQILAAIRKVRRSLEFTPKELLYLARRAHSLAPDNADISAELSDLEALAAIGCMNIGMIGESLRAVRC